MEIDRTFETEDINGNPIKLKLLVSNYEISRLCEIEYKKAWAFCLSEGVKTRQRLEEDLRDAGVWTNREEAKVKDLESKAAIFNILLNEAVKKKEIDEARQAALELAGLRSRLEDLLSIKQAAFSYSCEGTAAEVRAEAFVAYATVYANDETKHYWSGYKEFTERREEKAAQEALAKYVDIMVTENITILKELPENKFFIEHGILDSDLKPVKPKIVRKKKVVKKKVIKKKVKKSKIPREKES